MAKPESREEHVSPSMMHRAGLRVRRSWKGVLAGLLMAAIAGWGIVDALLSGAAIAVLWLLLFCGLAFAADSAVKRLR
ncbi:MAG: hypothetical protein OXB98_02625 [Bryobacterales bacterium]|nr:hypothetical protein [Bryobacterales bacterium]